MARADTINLPRGGKRSVNSEGARASVAVGYCRCSTDRQEQSIPDQKAAIEKYATERQIRLLRFYVDDAISGTSTVGRKAFQQLVEDAKVRGCEFGLVIVYDVKRFGRIDNDEAGYWRYILKTNGVEVMYCSENFTGDRTDDLLRPVKQWQAREESKDLSKVAIRGLLTRTTLPAPPIANGNGNGQSSSKGPCGGAGGWWMGGAPPYGYDLAYENQFGEFLFYLRYMRDGTKVMFNKDWKPGRTLQRGESMAVSRKDRCKLVPGEEERVKVVQRIFKLYVNEGRGFKAIADVLNRDGVPTPRGPEWSDSYGGLWTISSVRAILLNPVYGGDMVWNRRTDARFHRIVAGQAQERKGVYHRRLEWNDEEDWIIVPDAHPPLVKRRMWEMARQLLRSKPESECQRGINPRTGQVVDDSDRRGGAGKQWTGPRMKFLLSGLIACPRCGRRYEGRINYGLRSSDDGGQRKRSYVYGCGGYIRHGKSVCSLGAIKQEVIEEAVIKAVVEYYGRYTGPSGDKKIAEALNVQVGKSKADTEHQQKNLQARSRKIDATVRKLLDNISAKNKQLVDRRIGELEQEKRQLDERLAAISRMSMTDSELDDVVRKIAQFIGCLESTLRHGSFEERQGAIRRCVKKLQPESEKNAVALTVHSIPGEVHWKGKEGLRTFVRAIAL